MHPTPQAVADGLRATLGRSRRLSIFEVELIQTTRGCTARARIGPIPSQQTEISGLGATLEEAIVDMYNRARESAS